MSAPEPDERSREAIRGLLLFVMMVLPLCAVVFLLASQFVMAWEGKVVAVSPIGTEEPAWYRVLIVSGDGEEQVRRWPADLVNRIDARLQPQLLPPIDLNGDYPETRKNRFQLHFFVEGREGGNITHQTTSPQALGLSVLTLIVLVGLRNMYVSGSPVDIRSRRHVLPAPLPHHGQVAPPPKGAKSRYEPPPKGGGRKRGRR